MGPGAPVFARGHPIVDTGELSLASASLKSRVSKYQAQGTPAAGGR